MISLQDTGAPQEVIRMLQGARLIPLNLLPESYFLLDAEVNSMITKQSSYLYLYASD